MVRLVGGAHSPAHTCQVPDVHSPRLAELDNFPEGEVEEMVQLYNRKGLPEHAARTVVSAMASMPDFFVDVMMLEELQMSPPPSISAVSAAMRICCSMLVCGGALPLVFTLLHRTTSMTPTTTTSHADADVTAYLIVVALAAGTLPPLAFRPHPRPAPSLPLRVPHAAPDVMQGRCAIWAPCARRSPTANAASLHCRLSPSHFRRSFSLALPEQCS